MNTTPLRAAALLSAPSARNGGADRRRPRCPPRNFTTVGPHILYRSLMEALSTLNSPPVVSFKFRDLIDLAWGLSSNKHSPQLRE